MTRNRQSAGLFYLLVLVLLSLRSCAIGPASADDETLTIASFNIQVFGQTKAGKSEVMDILAEIIRSFDIVAIQEIRDAAETAILALRDQVNSDGSTYAVVTGPRVGRTSSKEQYAFMYDTQTIELLGATIPTTMTSMATASTMSMTRFTPEISSSASPTRPPSAASSEPLTSSL
jgi:hypothetical protein